MVCGLIGGNSVVWKRCGEGSGTSGNAFQQLSHLGGKSWTNSFTSSGGKRRRVEPECPGCPPRFRSLLLFPRRSARWPGESLEGGLFELPELRPNCSLRAITTWVSSSTLRSSSAMRASFAASCASRSASAAFSSEISTSRGSTGTC